MAKAAKPIYQQPIFIVGAVAIAVAGYFLTEPETTSGSGLKAVQRKASKKPARVGTVEFTKEDELASFSRVKPAVRNAFKPEVARRGGLGGGDGAANMVPTDITGGDANWVYTGNAEIDGVANALLENRSSGEGVFLRKGERWKSGVVVSIGGESIVMSGPNGNRTLSMLTQEATPSAPSGGVPRMAGGGFQPVNPGLSGPIGTLPAVTPGGGGPVMMSSPSGMSFSGGEMMFVPSME